MGRDSECVCKGAGGAVKCAASMGSHVMQPCCSGGREVEQGESPLPSPCRCVADTSVNVPGL